jgi:YetA-like protein
MHIEVESPDQTTRRHEPVSCGVPWPRGVLRDVAQLRLFDENRQPVGLQSRALACWPDNSVRWALLDWRAVVATKATYHVEIAAELSTGVDSPKIQLRQEAQSLTIDTGAACFVIRSGVTFPFESVSVAGQPAINPAQAHLTVECEEGQIFHPRLAQVELVESGPLRVVIRVNGSLGRKGRGRPWCLLSAYLHFFAGLAVVRFDLTLHNPRPAGHPGNFWSLGEMGSIYIRDAALTLTLPKNSEPTRVQFSPEPSAPFRAGESPLELYQDSSGGENWRSTVHFNRHQVVPNSFRGYRIRDGDHEEAGRRATPIVTLEGGGRWLGMAMEYFWQNFPKSIEATPDSITLRLFPKQYADVHELQGGEQKTHTFWISLAPDGVADEPLAWCRAPLRPRAAPSWYCSTGAMARLSPQSDDPHILYLQLVNAAIEGDDTFAHKREVIDEYGWRDFGDIYADHEAIFQKGPNLLVSHYNNQYDPIAGFALQFLRSGDMRWWLFMHELALHVRDVDVYHTDQDKSAYNHGLFWHTWHYVDAGTSTHRAHPSRTKNVSGGGPSGGQNYATGLMLHYFLTGDNVSRETVIELARWTIDMDDGRKTIFRWLAGGSTGHATSSGSSDYHGPGRAPGNCVNTLLDGFRLTGEQMFVDKAEQIIRRCIHPLDDIEARNLLDAENKWFYTMFLQALGRYLDFKAEYAQLDRMYAYARSSLRNYALWMAEHEYPYLDKPELLEYPTETWAAQDMRKSEVFEAAARVAATTDERERFLERSRFFFESSTTTLARLPTRSLARPVVLLLSNGLARAFSQLNPDFPSLPSPESTYDFGLPESFTPQKTVAIRRFKCLVALTGVAALAALISVLSVLMWRA